MTQQCVSKKGEMEELSNEGGEGQEGAAGWAWGRVELAEYDGNAHLHTRKHTWKRLVGSGSQQGRKKCAIPGQDGVGGCGRKHLKGGKERGGRERSRSKRESGETHTRTHEHTSTKIHVG